MDYGTFDAKTLVKYEKKNLAKRFQDLHQKKNTILRRCEDYADWTLPGIFPKLGTTGSIEQSQSVESLGARGVNHLSNRLILTLFQPSQPFFRLQVSSKQIRQLQTAAQQGNEDAKFLLENLDTILAESEKEALSLLDYTRYRTEATTATKLLIITGNALMYHPKGKGSAQVYNLRDYCVVRDLSGNVIEIITRDCKAYSTFSDAIKKQLMASKDKENYEAETDVTIYTCLRLEDDGKFHMTQGADNIMLDSTGIWPVEELPWIPLTWNLLRGEDYGRGLVEDYAGTFHALNVLTHAEVQTVAVMADLKFGVDPASVVDIDELNKSESGSYHMMKRDDVFAIEVDKRLDLQTVSVLIDRLEKQLMAAFLLNSAVQRDAERVTAEEIRYVAQELETAYGGIYSRFAEEWQLRTAVLLLKQIKMEIGQDVFPQIITGLDSLSNAGEMNNMELFLRDLSLLNNIPEEFRAVIDPRAYAMYSAVRRGVEYQKILKSPEQIQAEQQQMMQMQQQQMAAQASANVAESAGAAAAQSE